MTKTRTEAFDLVVKDITDEVGVSPDEIDLKIARRLFSAGAAWRKEHDDALCERQASLYLSVERTMGAEDCARVIRKDEA